MGKTYRKNDGKKKTKGALVRGISREMFKDMPIGKVFEDKDKSEKYKQNWHDLIEEDMYFEEE